MRVFAIVALLMWAAQALAATPATPTATDDPLVRLKDLGRMSGWRDNALTGYGVVSGLAGTGDSPRNQATRQSIASMLQNFDVKITPDQVASRNAAAVMITATLPPYARRGDTLDITVTSLGDARSLVGGSLLLAPLKGPDGRIYALAQGAISVGGYKYDLNGNVVQKNHPTVGNVPAGATVELPVAADLLTPQHRMTFSLARPDHTTAQRAAEAINAALGPGTAFATSAADIDLKPSDAQLRNVVGFVTAIESVTVAPDRQARVVINERTGVIVSGGDVRISRVAISFGELRVAITTENSVSQPDRVVLMRSQGVRSLPYSNTRVDVTEERGEGHVAARHNTVADLVAALSRMKTPTRDVISILQAVKGAGALHAELIIQ